jgi:hypothetical protein
MSRVAGWALLFLAACAGGAGQGAPERALDAYANAVAANDYDRAYGLMSAEYRHRVPHDDFVRFLKDNAHDVHTTAERLHAGVRAVELLARLDYGQGDTLRVVKEGGEWRLAEDPLDLFGQRTPREALRSFVRALERRRYDVLCRFVPKKWRELTTADRLREQWEGPQRDEIATLVRNLRAHLQDPIQEDGDEARMPYGSGLAVKFVREDGLWRILDPDCVARRLQGLPPLGSASPGEHPCVISRQSLGSQPAGQPFSMTYGSR